MLSLVSICHDYEEFSVAKFKHVHATPERLALGYPQSFVADLGIVGMCFCLSALNLGVRVYSEYLGSS